MPEDRDKPSGADDTEGRAAEALSVQISGVPVERPLARIWRAKDADGQDVALVVVRHAAPRAERELFGAAAERLHGLGRVPGLLHVRSVSPSRDAYLADLLTTGTAKDIDAFQWSVRRRLEFVKTVSLALESLHKAGAVHGCLCEENVLLADDLTPVLAEAGSVSVNALSERGGDAASYVAFAAPEIHEGGEPDARSDVYALGRLLQHVLRTDDVPQVADIVRRCVAPTPASRYASAAAVGAAIVAAADALPKVHAPALTPASQPRAREPGERKVEAPDVEPAREEPRPPARWPAPVGALMLIGAVAAAFVGAGASTVVGGLLSGAFAVGVALLVWAVLPRRRTPKALRVGFALAAAAVVADFGPLDYASRSSATRSIAHGHPDTRRAAIAQIMQLGGDFRGMSLAGADLAGVDLHGANLRDLDLSRADLSGANLSGTELANSSFEGVKIFGADMRLSFGFPLSFASAACDAKTILPGPWRCINGHPSDVSIREGVAPAR
jgi:hypothetical protein